MFSHQLLRNLHIGLSCWNASKKAALSELRKKTGFTFVNCKKALELHEYNVEQAEKWLNDQALAMGWEKALKLENRVTIQGLVGVLVKNNIAAMVEVNCETDFVARNELFQKMVKSTASACVDFTMKQNTQQSLSRFDLSADDMKSLAGEGGKTLHEELLMLINSVGEKLALRRATCFLAKDDILVSGYVHPRPPLPGVMLGRFGSILAFKSDGTLDKLTLETREICQHIVGMNPVKIGVPDVDIPHTDPDEEPCLIYQEFLLDPSMTIGQKLIGAGITAVDFMRFECGEKLDLPKAAEACQ